MNCGFATAWLLVVPCVRFGILPSKFADLDCLQKWRFFPTHSSFGTSNHPSAEKMGETLRILEMIAPNLEVEGEMHADAAIIESLRNRIFPNSRLHGKANLQIMPNIDAANITVNLLKSVADGQPSGPILMGANKAVHILTPSITTRGIINMTAIAAVDAQVHEGDYDISTMDAAKEGTGMTDERSEHYSHEEHENDVLGVSQETIRALEDALEEHHYDRVRE